MMINECHNQILLRLQIIERFINLTVSEDKGWLFEQDESNHAIGDIRTFLTPHVHIAVFNAALNRERWVVLEWTEKAGLIDVTAINNKFVVGRSFLREELDKLNDPTQFMIDWFLAHEV